MHCKVLILTVWLRDAVLVKDSHIPLAHHWVNPTRSRIVSLAAVFRMWRNAPPKESSFRGALRVIQKTAARETRSRSDMGSNPIWARIFFRVSILLMKKSIMLLYFHERLTWFSKIELIWFYESGTCFSSLATTFPFKVVFQRLLKPLSRNKTRFYEDFEIKFPCIGKGGCSQFTLVMVIRDCFYHNARVKYSDRSRQDIYYHNIASTISWHAVSKKKKNASRGVPN